MILSIVVISLFIISPLPALPVIIFYYKKFPFFDSLRIILSVSLISTSIQYLIGYRLSKINFINKKFLGKLDHLRIRFNKLSFRDAVFIRFSNLFVVKLFNYFCGYIRFSLRDILIINFFAASL